MENKLGEFAENMNHVADSMEEAVEAFKITKSVLDRWRGGLEMKFILELVTIVALLKFIFS